MVVSRSRVLSERFSRKGAKPQRRRICAVQQWPALRHEIQRESNWVVPLAFPPEVTILMGMSRSPNSDENCTNCTRPKQLLLALVLLIILVVMLPLVIYAHLLRLYFLFYPDRRRHLYDNDATPRQRQLLRAMEGKVRSNELVEANQALLCRKAAPQTVPPTTNTSSSPTCPIAAAAKPIGPLIEPPIPRETLPYCRRLSSYMTKETSAPDLAHVLSDLPNCQIS